MEECLPGMYKMLSSIPAPPKGENKQTNNKTKLHAREFNILSLSVQFLWAFGGACVYVFISNAESNFQQYHSIRNQY
jgi:hypothetical protein